MRRKGRGWLWSSVCSIFGTLILLSVCLTALPLALPRFLGYEAYSVISGSMEPAIPVGSVIYVEAAEPEAVSEGEIIVFRAGDSVVTHRVAENRFVVGEFVTKGDANEREDLRTVPYDALIGRVVRHIPLLGMLLGVYASTAGRIYVLMFALCGVMLQLLAARLRAVGGADPGAGL